MTKTRLLVGTLAVFLTSTSPAIAQTNTPCPASLPAAQAGTTPVPVTQMPIVRLNEVLPDPAGDDTAGEFIELANLSSFEANLAGWSLRNAAGKTFTLNVIVPANGYRSFAYTETKLTLANGGSTLALHDATGASVDTMTYPAAKTDRSYARNADGVWEWITARSPGLMNAFPEPEPEPEPTPPAPETQALATETTETGAATETSDTEIDPEHVIPAPEPGSTEPTTDTKPEESEPLPLGVAEAATLPAGSAIRLTGVVTVPPGVLSKTVFALQDVSGRGGITVQIYGTISAFTEGDLLIMSGTIRMRSGRPYIATKAADIKVVGSELPTPRNVDLSQLEDLLDGTLVRTMGVVMARTAAGITIADDSLTHELIVRDVERTAIDALTDGAAVTVTGIIKRKAGVPELLLMPEGLETEPPPPAPEPAEPSTKLTSTEPGEAAIGPETPPAAENTPATGWAAAAAACSTVAAFIARKKGLL